MPRQDAGAVESPACSPTVPWPLLSAHSVCTLSSLCGLCAESERVAQFFPISLSIPAQRWTWNVFFVRRDDASLRSQAQLSALETEGLKSDLQQLRDEIKGISGGYAAHQFPSSVALSFLFSSPSLLFV